MTEPPEDSEPSLHWGTNKQGGTADRYAGRVHVVWPDNGRFGLCGLPIEEVWRQRPPVPDNLCPLCCVRAMAVLFPALSESRLTSVPATGRHALAVQDHHAPTMPLAEQTMLIPAVEPDDFFS